MTDPHERISYFIAQIAELKARWLAHSVRTWMLQQLEEFEEKLEMLRWKEKTSKKIFIRSS
jgi:hypothetical protein